MPTLGFKIRITIERFDAIALVHNGVGEREKAVEGERCLGIKSPQVAIEVIGHRG